MNKYNASLFISIVCLVLIQLTSCKTETKTEAVGKIDGPYFATGVKVGEVSQDKVIIWTRLTKSIQRIGSDTSQPNIFYKHPETG